MKSLIVCFFVALMGVSSGGIEEILVKEYGVYRKRLNPNNYPMVERGPAYRDGDKFYRGHSLNVVIRICIEDGKIDAEEFMRGLFHRKEFVRATCVWFMIGLFPEDLNLDRYPEDTNITTDPFTNDVVWRNQCELRRKVGAAWPKLSKKSLLKFDANKNLRVLDFEKWGKVHWLDLPLRVKAPPLR